MDDSERFQAWLDQVCARALPQNAISRVRILARELAEGAIERHWGSEIYAFRGAINETAEPKVAAYLARRWDAAPPGLHLLISIGYLVWNDNSYTIQKPAFDLLDDAEPANIFISYKRSESSAFALLVLARLKQAGLEPFLDLSLVPGEDWQQGLKGRIQKFDYLIVLLGKDTLGSEVVLQEIRWALDSGLQIIPVWHNAFRYVSGVWPVPAEVDRLLAGTHTIRVLEESALAYNNAIVELLNRFGITP